MQTAVRAQALGIDEVAPARQCCSLAPGMLTARQRILIGSTILVTGLAVGFAWDPHGIRRWIELGEDVELVERENERLRREIDVMRRQVSALRGGNGDDSALERAARERGYVRQDELLFEFRP